MTSGIDVSQYQTENFSFKKAALQGAEYAIIRLFTAESSKDDKLWRKYYENAKLAGVPVGFYVFGDAGTIEEANAEADRALNLLKSTRAEFPIFYDVESKRMMDCDKRLLTDIIKTFCDKLEKAGYWVGIYSSRDVFDNKMYDAELSKYSHWVAFWSGNKPTLRSGNEVQMWQTGVYKDYQPGIDVDQDRCYVDYKSKIISRGLNNWGKTDPDAEILANLAVIRQAADDIEEIIRKRGNAT